eukprot:1404052-Prymnesium_polylepis.1
MCIRDRFIHRVFAGSPAGAGASSVCNAAMERRRSTQHKGRAQGNARAFFRCVQAVRGVEAGVDRGPCVDTAYRGGCEHT